MRFLPSGLIVVEGSRLAQFQVSGQLFGLFLGTLVDYFGKGPHTLFMANLLMVILWTLFLVYLSCSLRQIKLFAETRAAVGSNQCNESNPRNDDSSSSVGSEQETDPAKLFSIVKENEEEWIPQQAEGQKEPQAAKPKVQARKRQQRLRSYANRFRKLLAFNVAIPLTMAMIIFTAFSQEVMFSSCALITNRYFSWAGRTAGLLLCSLTALMLPIDYVCERFVRKYEERKLLQVG
jgi:hypothetical protein